jgi:transposase-like protein
VSEGAKEDKASWTEFLRGLKERGLKGVELFVSDKCLGLVENLADFYPEAKWQRCVVHFYRNEWSAVPAGKVKEVAAMQKAMHAQEDTEAAKQKARLVVEKLRARKLTKAVENGIGETLSYYSLPLEHWRCLRTNNPLERLMREIRRRTHVVGAFPDGNSALMLVAARLRHVASTRWGTKRYLQMDRLARSSPSPDLLLWPHGARAINPDPTTFLSHDSNRKYERFWTLPINLLAPITMIHAQSTLNSKREQCFFET